MKIDLDAANVFEKELSVEECRKLLEGNSVDAFEDGLDEAQGYVHSQQGPVAYLVFVIRS